MGLKLESLRVCSDTALHPTIRSDFPFILSSNAHHDEGLVLQPVDAVRERDAVY